MSKENAKLKKWMKITPFFENYMKKNRKKLKSKIRKGIPRLNPKYYENNGNPIIVPKNYNYNINKDSYAYKVTKKNNYKYNQDYETNQITRPITSLGNDYNRNNVINKKNENKQNKNNTTTKDFKN